MAVCRWLYANAKLESDRKDYFVRICDPELEACRGILIELSNRLLSADKRRKETGKQVCWFAGYIHAGIYLIAAGRTAWHIKRQIPGTVLRPGLWIYRGRYLPDAKK